MRKLLLIVASVLPTLLVVQPAHAFTASPGSGSISASSPTVSWTGSAWEDAFQACAGRGAVDHDPRCITFYLTVDPVEDHEVLVNVDVPDDVDWDVSISDRDSIERAASRTRWRGADERAQFPVVVRQTFRVTVEGFDVKAGSTFAATAELVPGTDMSPVDGAFPCPESTVPEHVFDTGDVLGHGHPPMGFHVRVLLDGVSEEDGLALVERATRVFEPHAIVMGGSVEVVSTPGSGPLDTVEALVHARDHLGGRRGPYDLVYLATSRDLTSAGLGAAATGRAMCVGGVKDPRMAFAVGEVTADDAIALGPVGLGADASAKVFAHELGHLLGADHHQASCVEGTDTDDVSGDTAPCTLMTDDVALRSLTLGLLERAVIHYHVETYLPHCWSARC